MNTALDKCVLSSNDIPNLHKLINCLCGAVVSISSYELHTGGAVVSTSAYESHTGDEVVCTSSYESHTGQSAGSLPSCSAFLYKLVDKMSTWGTVWIVNCRNLVITTVQCPGITGSHPPQAHGPRRLQ